MTDLLTAIAIVFILAGPFLLLAYLVDLPTAPALILAGIAAGLFIDEELVLEVARLGIALLVFTFAIKLDTKAFGTTVMPEGEVVALVQLAVLGALGFLGGVVLGLAPDQAIYLGVAAAISSSIVGTTLFVPAQTDAVHDRLSESIHAVQDFLGLFLLLILTAGAFSMEAIAMEVGYGAILLLAAIAINRYLFDLIGYVSNGSDEAMLIGTIALLILFLGAAEFVNLSIVVGAFAAGLAIRDEPVRYSGVINGLDSINTFFAAIFFLTVGALVPWPTLDVLLMSVVLVGLVAVVKPAITIALLIYRGYERRTATLTGFNLDQVGEFALIIAIETLILGIILRSVFEAVILAAAITLVTASFTRLYEERIYHLLSDIGVLGEHRRIVDRWRNVPDDLADHLVIVGYGRHGRNLVDVCEDHGQPYVVIESNPALIEDLQEQCAAYVFGDVIEPDTWQTARLMDARLVISTADLAPVNEHLMQFTDAVDVIVRTKHLRSAKRYLDQGALYVSVTDLLAADRLEGSLKDLLERPEERERWKEEAMTAIYRQLAIPRLR